LSGRPADHVIEVVELGSALLEWGDDGIAAAVDAVARSDLAVIASPTYKATYTGLLKTFLDKFTGGTGMQGVVTVPLMLGGAWNHALAAELTLKPVLAELGATTALPGLFLLESEFESDGRIEEYAQRWAPVVAQLSVHCLVERRALRLARWRVAEVPRCTLTSFAIEAAAIKALLL